MTDKEYREQKARIKALIPKWVYPLGLRWWKVTFEYERDGLELGAHIENNGSAQCLARTSVRWQYLDALIVWNMPALVGTDDEELEKSFVHELCHIFVHEMREWAGEEMEKDKLTDAIRHEERVVTQLTAAMLWLRKHAFDEGKRKRLPKRSAKRR